VNTKRKRLLDIIQALTQKTVGNGCTESEALAAAEKAQRIMEKYGLSLADLEVIDPVSECEQSETEFGACLHPIVHAAAGAIAEFTGTECWWIGGSSSRLVFLGLPGDVRIATYLAKIIRDAMDLEWRFWWAVNCGLTPVRPNTARKNFMDGMGVRIACRLYSMKQKRESRNNDCKAIVLRKKNITEKALKATGIKFYAARWSSSENFDDASYSAGSAAGTHTSLNAGELK